MQHEWYKTIRTANTSHPRVPNHRVSHFSASPFTPLVVPIRQGQNTVFSGGGELSEAHKVHRDSKSGNRDLAPMGKNLAAKGVRDRKATNQDTKEQMEVSGELWI